MEFRTLLYIPERAPPNFLNDYYGHKAQLKLYVRRVFISDDFEELIPRHASRYSTAIKTALTFPWRETALVMYSLCHTILSCDSRMLVLISPILRQVHSHPLFLHEETYRIPLRHSAAGEAVR